MKCGIVTITSPDLNYGNVLQNLALQQVIKRFGYESETIQYNEEFSTTDRPQIMKTLRQWQSVGAWRYEIGRIIRKYVYKHKHPDLEKKRYERFRTFSHKHINKSEEDYSMSSDLTSLNLKYDVFIAGSDQIWNPYYEGTDPFYFLDFTYKSKRIAYASSFGVSNIPPEQHEYYRYHLNSIDAISVREERGREIIENLTGRSVQVVPDPTMLLTKEEWLSFANKTECRPEKGYILAYFLGKIIYPIHKSIAKYAQGLNIPVLTLNNPCDTELYAAGPAEFLDLVAHADIILTDSFHGCVFSLIFNRPFVVFDRVGLEKQQTMNSRIDTLARDFNILHSREIKKFEDVFAMDFIMVNTIIQKKRGEAFNYLTKSFGRYQAV